MKIIFICTLNIKMLSRNVCWYWIKIIVETLRRSRRGSGDDDDDGNEMDEEDHTDTETATVLEYQMDNLIIRMGGVGWSWSPLSTLVYTYLKKSENWTRVLVLTVDKRQANKN